MQEIKQEMQEMLLKNFNLQVIIIALLFSISSTFIQAREHFKEINPYDPETIPEFLQKRISVYFHEVKADEALLSIAEKGGFHINFNRSQLPLHHKITLEANTGRILDLILLVLKDIDVNLISSDEKNLIIKPIPQSKFGIIKGQVTDSESGFPLIGTNIVIVGKGLGGSTDAEGSYIIKKIPKGNYDLSFS